ncbi:hypothetical protein KI387_028787, partial [Taxus chinensis]
MSMARSSLDELDDNILLIILFNLSELSLRDAVRCTVISKRWRAIFLRLSHLRFTRKNHFLDYYYFWITPRGSLEEAIDNILARHHGPLQRFEFDSQSPLGPHEKDRHRFLPVKFIRGSQRQKICEWIECAGRHRVSELRISAIVKDFEIDIFDVPSTLFGCVSEHLKYLYLRNFVWKEMSMPIDFDGFKCLKTGHLHCVFINEDAIFERFLEQCPNLEKLKISGCDWPCPDELGPGLKNLKISGAVNLKSLSLENLQLTSLTITRSCPRLTSIKFACFKAEAFNLDSQLLSVRKINLAGVRLWNFHSYIRGKRSFACHSIHLLAKFPTIEELIICTFHLQGQGQELVPNEVGPALILPLMQLKKLHINTTASLGEGDVAVACFFLRTAPTLKIMSVKFPLHIDSADRLRFVDQILDLE